VIFVACLGLVCGLSVFIGLPTPLGNYAHDTFFFLDNAYRVIQGQVPHRDFSSAWGPVIYLIQAVGLALSGMRPPGLGYANALFGAAIAVWAFLIVRLRWSPACACAIGIYTILLISSPFPISGNPLDFGYAMVYNRYGYALFGIIMMECAAYAAPTHGRTRQSAIGTVSTGTALGLLAFLKISYAIVALGFIVVMMVCADAGRVRRLIALSGGFAMVTLLTVAYLRFDVSDMLRDLATAAAARRLALQLRPLPVIDWVQGVSLLIFAASRYGATDNADRTRAAWFRGALFALLSVAAGYILLITNAQVDTFPLNAYAAIALSAMGGPLAAPRWPGSTPGFPRVWLLGICFLPLFLLNGISLIGAALERQLAVIPNVAALTTPERATYLRFRPLAGKRTETSGPDYAESLDDGLALLLRQSDHDGVLTFDEFNPFNYLLDRPSPRGGFAAAAYNYVFSDDAHPTAQRFFGDTRYVMVRKYTVEGSDVLEVEDVLGLMRLYGAYLRSQFMLVEQSKHWALWRRRLPSGSGS
jgi:hypothetical protein